MSAGVIGLLFCWLFFGLLAAPTHGDSNSILMGALGLSAIPAAAIAWPRNAPRTAVRMFVAGFLTVLMAISFIGLGFGLFAAFDQTSSDPILNELLMMVTMMVLTLLFGTLISLGIPYILGGVVSLLFTDPVDPS